MSNQPLEVNPPLSAEDRRPNDRPFYINECCPKCNQILVYSDILDGETDWEEIWFDEFSCPKCQDGVYLDSTPNESQKLAQAIKESEEGNIVPVTQEMWDEIEALVEGVEVND